MELTERAVRVLVDYLYTGRLCLQSDLVLLLEVARAANCFQLENVVRWTHGLVLANVSEVVRARRGYDVMGEMDLLTHLQSPQLTDWEDIRDLLRDQEGRNRATELELLRPIRPTERRGRQGWAELTITAAGPRGEGEWEARPP